MFTLSLQLMLYHINMKIIVRTKAIKSEFCNNINKSRPPTNVYPAPPLGREVYDGLKFQEKYLKKDSAQKNFSIWKILVS